MGSNTMTNGNKGNKRFVGPGLFVGLWLTTLGVIFLLDQLGLVPAHVSFHFVWPAILIAFGASGILSGHPAGRFWGWILVGLGLISVTNELGVLNIRIGSLWPLVLIAIGVWMLLNSSGRFGDPTQWSRHWSKWPNPAAPGTQDPTYDPAHDPGGGAPPGSPPPPQASFFGVNSGIGSSDGATFDQAVILSGFKRRISSQRFRYGKATAVLGGFHLDFTRADIDGDQAVLHIDTVFGGGEVRVPETWKIVIEATAVAGAFVDETYPPPAGAPAKQLIVRGAAVFGGVSIKN
jgi:LiaF transmembrane domain